MDRQQIAITQRFPNLLLVIIVLPVGIFLAETLAMIVIRFYEGPYSITILFDAILTTFLMLPLIYVTSYRPLLKHLRESERSKNIMQVRLRLIQFAASHTVNELLKITLDEVENLTGSTIGFFHFLEPDQETIWLQNWSTNTIRNMCKADGQGSHYSVDQAGVWADCIRQRKVVIHNDYPSLDYRKGTPEGHALITREMTVPILRNEQVVAILGVGNKSKNYTTHDVDLTSTLADFAWDIISQKRVEDALRESEEKFRTLVDWTYDWEKWVDPQGKIIYTSPSCERITGYSAVEFISNPCLLENIVHPDDQKIHIEHKQILHDEYSGPSTLEYRIIAQDGSVHWIEHICRPLFGRDDQYLGRRVSSRDISLRKQTEKEIFDRNQKEAMLTQAIHTMQLDIARDLHDTVGQNISFLRMKLDYLSETDLQTQEDLKSDINSMLKVADESYNLIRGTLDVLQTGGLINPLTLFTQYATQIEERSTFRTNVSSKGELRPLSPAQVRQLFFVFREALSNIEKYAKASEVCVDFIWNENTLDLAIVDNGRGFHLEDTQVRRQYGLKFMRERIEALNGDFSVQSKHANGTSIRITLPYETE